MLPVDRVTVFELSERLECLMTGQMILIVPIIGVCIIRINIVWKDFGVRY